MGKFDGILLCTDLDGTLLNDEHVVSQENTNAIEYFKSEGGKFTFITGRVHHGAKLLLDFVHPNIPVVTFNGAGISDFNKDELIWGIYLDEDAISVVKYVDENIKGLGLAVCTDKTVHFCKRNRWVDEFAYTENLPLTPISYTDVNEPWKKVLFITEDYDLYSVRNLIANSEYADKYEFVQSSPYYYELLPIEATKGNGVKRLAELMGIDPNKIIAIGDNENDISMIKTAKLGVAVSNAIDELKAVADLVTVSNNEHAIAKIITMLDSGEIHI